MLFLSASRKAMLSESAAPGSPGEAPPGEGARVAGGGFPEELGAAFADNVVFREALRKSIDEGLPVWAECGGRHYLSGAPQSTGQASPMGGAPPRAPRRGRPASGSRVLQGA